MWYITTWITRREQFMFIYIILPWLLCAVGELTTFSDNNRKIIKELKTYVQYPDDSRYHIHLLNIWYASVNTMEMSSHSTVYERRSSCSCVFVWKVPINHKAKEQDLVKIGLHTRLKKFIFIIPPTLWSNDGRIQSWSVNVYLVIFTKDMPSWGM